ncbi:MAG TPA: hypothetical protein DDW27_13565 [Bacteroidales bacterium]|nr:hypothetical protein [Bacteroidales bacterium]
MLQNNGTLKKLTKRMMFQCFLVCFREINVCFNRILYNVSSSDFTFGIMKPDSDIKRLFKVAIYTSPLIGILAITPIFIHRAVSISIFPKAVLIITLATLTVWWLNIFLFFISENIKSFKYARVIRYIVSYLLSAVLIIAAMRMLRLCFYSPSEIQNITF